MPYIPNSPQIFFFHGRKEYLFKALHLGVPKVRMRYKIKPFNSMIRSKVNFIISWNKLLLTSKFSHWHIVLPVCWPFETRGQVLGMNLENGRNNRGHVVAIRIDREGQLNFKSGVKIWVWACLLSHTLHNIGDRTNSVLAWQLLDTKVSWQ